MRSIGLLAVGIGMLVLASACSDGGGTTPPDNLAPVANFALPPCSIDVPCDFASTSTDDVQVTEWSWDFNGDGTPDATTANFAYTYRTAADFNVSLTVHDAQGLSHTKTSTITIAPPTNTPPTAGFTYNCNAADCTFTSTSTDVAPGTIVTLAWDFGDGANADVNAPSHTYSVTASTSFTVTLTVTDNEGATAVATETITVTPAASANTPPTANFTYSCNTVNCTFVSTSTDAAPGSIASYAWTFGDNATAAVSNPSHGYSITAPTTFTVTLTVTDNEGATAVVTKTITVDPAATLNQPPVARFTFSCAAAVCTFVNTSYDHTGRITANAWTFGDNGTSTEASPSHTYGVTAATQFTVTLTATDNLGAKGVTSQTFTLDPSAANTPPTAGFTTWCYGEGCIFTSTSADASPGAIATYAWTFGDGATEDWKAPSHTYSIAGRTTFTVTLTVTDNQGATAVATQQVTVTPLPPAVQGCSTITVSNRKIVDCVLDIPARSTLKLKLLGISCNPRTATDAKITAPPPVGDQIFLSLCWKTAGPELGVFGGKLDELIVYQAGTQARIWFHQGTAVPAGRVLDPPAGRVEGAFPDWTISFEDGDHPDAAGEPEFTDVVLGVHATPR
ncbi:MAG: PKD domain-containing protein [Gemmatimonadales bacterium]